MKYFDRYFLFLYLFCHHSRPLRKKKMEEQLLQKIQDFMNTNEPSLTNLRLSDIELHNTLINQPLKVLPLLHPFDQQLNILKGPFSQESTPRLLSYDLNKLISVSGIVTTISIPSPQPLISVHYEKDNNFFYSKNHFKRVFEGENNVILSNLYQHNPYMPTHFHTSPLRFEPGLSEYADIQKIIIQENLNSSTGIPRGIEVYLIDDLVNTVKPGDKVKIKGVYKSIFNKTHFRGVLIALDIEKGKGSFHIEDDNLNDDILSMMILSKFLPLKHFCVNKENLNETNQKVFSFLVSLHKDLNDRLNNPNKLLELTSTNNTSLTSNNASKYDSLSLLSQHNSLQFENIENEELLRTSLLCNYFLEKNIFLTSQMDKDFILFSNAIKGNELKCLSKFIAPSIFGLETVKAAITLMLVSGSAAHIRTTINIMLLGDPSTAKSQILRYVATLFNLITATGRGSSGVGLTALISSDGEKHIQAGAMVLSDGSAVCIDEFDKISKDDSVCLHEAMEQQIVSINKAGINVRLNARCSVLAAANPFYCVYPKKKGMKFRKTDDVVDMLGMEESLISRFDMVFVLHDKVDERTDRLIAKKVIDNHTDELNKIQLNLGEREDYNPDKGFEEENNNIKTFKDKNEELQDTIKADYLKINEKNIFLFKKYILAVKELNPKLSKEAQAMIVRHYVEMRQQKKNNILNIKITPRTLESLMRMSISHAKLRLSDVVEEKDVKIAISILKESMFKGTTTDLKKEDSTNIIKEENTQSYTQTEDDFTTITDLLFNLKENLGNRFILFKDFCEITRMEPKRIESILWDLNENDIIIFDGNLITFI